MTGIFRQSFDDTAQAQETELIGGTDQVKIGNVADRLKVQSADIESATFVSTVTGIAIGNNKSMFSIVNASVDKTVYLRQIKIMNSQTSAVTGVVADFRLLRCTGHSAGSQDTPEAHDTDDSLDAGITVRSGATVSGEGTKALYRWMWSSDDWSGGAPDTESADHAFQNTIALYEPSYKTKPPTLRPNQGFHIKQVTNSSAGTFDITVMFTVE
jgi:hypothetical protein